MDEVPIYFDMARGTTYDYKGQKNIHVIRTNGYKRRCTVVLCVLHDGKKLPPMIIFKSDSAISTGKFNGKAIVRSNLKGWISKSLMTEWIEKIWMKFSQDDKEIKLLILDKCSVHKEPSIVLNMQKNKNDYALIPAGCTGLIQPLDTCINKPLKDRLHQKFEVWFKDFGMSDKNKTTKGFYKCPSYEQLISWILEAWGEIDSNLIIKSFKHCGIIFYEMI